MRVGIKGHFFTKPIFGFVHLHRVCITDIARKTMLFIVDETPTLTLVVVTDIFCDSGDTALVLEQH